MACGNAEPLANAATASASSRASGAKPMIDGRGLDLAGPRRRREQQQGEAVGTAGNGNAEARAGLGKRVERRRKRSTSSARVAENCERA